MPIKEQYLIVTPIALNNFNKKAKVFARFAIDLDGQPVLDRQQKACSFETLESVSYDAKHKKALFAKQESILAIDIANVNS